MEKRSSIPCLSRFSFYRAVIVELRVNELVLFLLDPPLFYSFARDFCKPFKTRAKGRLLINYDIN